MLEIYFTENENVYEKLNGYLSERLSSPFKILRSENGKPYIEGDPLFFSLSHSRGKALIAICDRPVGADLEVITQRKYGAVLSRFPEREKREIWNTAHFLKHWTVREAYIKMLGSTIAEKLIKLEYSGGVLYDDGNKADCEIITERDKDLVYCICIDKRGKNLV